MVGGLKEHQNLVLGTVQAGSVGQVRNLSLHPLLLFLCYSSETVQPFS